MLGVCLVVASALGPWERLPSLPDVHGVAGAFAGVSGDALLVAGGANFPDKKPWDGGTKVWHDTVYVLDGVDGTWRTAGKLPRPLGYGVSVTHRGSVICVGGSDKDQHYSDCFRMAWNGTKLDFTPLPSLPRPVANACGAVVGDTLYLAGGLEKPDASATLKSLYTLDLAAKRPHWVEGESWPGAPRMLAVAASFDGAFWLIGGVDLEPDDDGKSRRKYLRDAYRFDPRKGWSRVADLPHACAAAPSPAPSDAGSFHLCGGDDGTNVNFTPLAKHPGFTKSILRFDAKTAKWKAVGEWQTPTVTTPCVQWKEKWVIPSGELRPGVRTPAVWQFALTGHEK